MHITLPTFPTLTIFTTLLLFLLTSSLKTTNASSVGAFQPIDSCQNHAGACEEEQNGRRKVRVRWGGGRFGRFERRFVVGRREEDGDVEEEGVDGEDEEDMEDAGDVDMDVEDVS
ncbi:predicted protein [Sclerotinia sclerotiorum 1980 UF-70]|uniref:Uncharacterized protein n=2 Tax=Sclerotinia sclerotiorum (strain ATCC 18683 / 1980 / Ss-1) TaxID=665079 RepID=A7F1J1_SCLS1|nr:predicted protein [Sclerotinia sclerotiorum 1980 UF-70]APA11242.1 hypothetical protein sscle_07g060120 [Sclerotinia sclerotiorum 1980 UF-70]EDN95583.1 predicted protein [Sclerotinia sclerotiorum 1980 UF-70]